MSVWESFTNQKQWKSYIQDVLSKNKKALLRALIIVYNNQTYDEQLYKVSNEENCKGFSKIDAEFLTKISEKVLNSKTITNYEFLEVKRRMPKYWKQIMIHSKDNIAKEKLYKSENEEKVKVEKSCPCYYGICEECGLYEGQMSLLGG